MHTKYQDHAHNGYQYTFIMLYFWAERRVHSGHVTTIKSGGMNEEAN